MGLELERLVGQRHRHRSRAVDGEPVHLPAPGQIVDVPDDAQRVLGELEIAAVASRRLVCEAFQSERETKSQQRVRIRPRPWPPALAPTGSSSSDRMLIGSAAE